MRPNGGNPAASSCVDMSSTTIRRHRVSRTLCLVPRCGAEHQQGQGERREVVAEERVDVRGLRRAGGE